MISRRELIDIHDRLSASEIAMMLAGAKWMLATEGADA